MGGTQQVQVQGIRRGGDRPDPVVVVEGRIGAHDAALGVVAVGADPASGHARAGLRLADDEQPLAER